MVLNFEDIKSGYAISGSVFFLFGNFKRSFDVFCDFVFQKVKENFENYIFDIHYCSLQECSRIIQSECDLFGNCFKVFCIRGIEDKDVDLILPLFSARSCIFLLECGDFRKSKKVTDYFKNDPKIYAIPSFNNDLSLLSLSKLMLPSESSKTVHQKIVNLIKNTDEPLLSFFKKISLLVTSEKREDIVSLLEEYAVYKNSFIQKLDFISFARYLQKSIVRNNFLPQKSQFFDNSSVQKSGLEKILKCEIEYKMGVTIPKVVLGSPL